MTRKKKLHRHHCYPSRSRQHLEEIKMVDSRMHAHWHAIVGDRTPREAVEHIAKSFLPTELEELLIAVIK